MTDNLQAWDIIYKSLVQDNNRYNDTFTIVNVYELTNYLDDLYEKITTLEKKLKNNIDAE